jgi:hypothetical protein
MEGALSEYCGHSHGKIPRSFLERVQRETQRETLNRVHMTLDGAQDRACDASFHDAIRRITDVLQDAIRRAFQGGSDA